MIEIIIFELHLLGALYAFVKSWQANGIKDGLMALAIIALFFTIGWAITGTIASFIYPDSWNSIYFTKDTLSLIMLLIPELIFYRFYFLEKEKNKDKSSQTG